MGGWRRGDDDCYASLGTPKGGEEGGAFGVGSVPFGELGGGGGGPVGDVGVGDGLVEGVWDCGW